MSEDNSYKPGLYEKGDRVKVAETARAAVALVFQGYRRSSDIPDAEAAQESDQFALDQVVDMEETTDAADEEPTESPNLFNYEL